MTLPFLTITAPTIGLGLVLPFPMAARARTFFMNVLLDIDITGSLLNTYSILPEI
jgi:hypothetical protein